MIYLKVFLLSTLLCFKLASAAECAKFIKVASGDYCYTLWTDNNLPETEFRALNPGINCDALQLGQQICVSAVAPSNNSPECLKKYKIASGDYCYKLWTNNNLTESEFLALNPGINCDALQIGQEICLQQGAAPTSPTIKNCFKEYEVVQGDTCYILQQDFLVSMPELMYFNKNLNCSNLQPGQILCFASENMKYECLKYEAFTSSMCSGMQEKYNLTLEQFKTINYDTECNKNVEGNYVCVTAKEFVNHPLDPPSPPIAPLNLTSNCGESYSIQSGDTCYQVAINFGLDLNDFMALNTGLNCDSLQLDQDVCVSKIDNCNFRYAIVPSDTCNALMTTFKLTMTDLQTLNPKLDCNNLKIAQQLCVLSAKDPIIPTMKCVKKSFIKSGDSCYSMQQEFGITLDELQFLNPWLNCNSMTTGKEICAFGESSRKCAVFEKPSASGSCDDLYDSLDISYQRFTILNPTFQCNKLPKTTQICAGQGYFLSPNCIESVKLTSTTNDCETIAKTYNLQESDLISLNPSINCSLYLDPEYFICIKSLGSQNVDSARGTVVDTLKSISPNLEKAFQDFRNSPTKENSQLMYNAILNTITNLNETQFQQLYDSNPEFKKVVDADTNQKQSRSELCNQIKDSQFSQSVKNCVCTSNTILYYCQLKLTKEAQTFLQNYQIPTNTSTRVKRKLPCQFVFPKPYGDYNNLPSVTSGCFGGGCAVPMPPLSLDIDANVCIPPVLFTSENIKFCNSNDGGCQTVEGFTGQGLNFLVERVITVSVKLCVGQPLKGILEFFNSPLCADLVNVEYKWFVGQVQITSGVELGIANLKVGGTFKSHDMLYPRMCQVSDFECETYCLWLDARAPNGRSFGVLTLKLAPLFGFDGFTAYDGKFGDPRTEKCNPDTLASVVVDNRRTCDKAVEVFCFSGDDDIDRQDLHETGFAFPFVPKKSTLFTCQFTLKSSGQMLGFDVYGGRSKKTGVHKFYYAVKNDGIYYGELKGEENTLVDWTKDTKTAKWDSFCNTDDEVVFGDKNFLKNIRRKGTVVNNVESPDDTDEPSEPSGTSGVPAAACNKRIVGYYTGWSKREVDETQLRKLTHVIFAFVAMFEDGSLAFDKVSEDSEADAGNIAKKRFLNLKSKARRVNAGVKISFAIGGWDNSQYFSSVAGDSSKRSKLVSSICKFLKDEGIDGIDLDWEYPVTGGAHEGTPADKQNFVALLKELRAALDNLQRETSRKQPYLISYASAAGDWTIRPAYDLDNIMKYVDFINLMTYDYFGAWGSQWGKYTGPPAPLYYGAPKGFSGKLNADYTTKYYTCKTKTPSKINMGVPFYGRFWNNVGGDIGGDEMWRTADAVGGVYDGGYVGWRDIGGSWNKGAAKMHPEVKSPYIWDAGARKYLGFENEESLKYKVDYAVENNIGGLMIWAIDQDDDANTLLNIVSGANLCSGGGGESMKYKCVPIDDIRWWTPENGGESKQGMCGKSAPLINGYYPVCDPDDPGYSCCGAAGYCGSEKDYCECDGCTDYRKDPDNIIKEPTKPTQAIQWYLMDAPDGQRGRCGPTAPKLNGKNAICNPDDDSKHCCSNGGYCGIGDEFCKCDGCVDFRANPNFQW